MVLSIGWPQVVYIALTILGLGIAAAKHGQPREPYSFPTSFFATAIVFAILYWGGFF